MKPLSRPLKRILILVSLLILGVALVAGYILIQAFGQVPVAKVAAPNSIEAEEAYRKLRRFEESLKTSQQGYIRLNELELNAILESRFSAALKKSQSELPPGAPHVVRGLVGLRDEQLTWYYWINIPLAKRIYQCVLRHAVELRRENDRWNFETVSMHVGRLPIPKRFWAKLEQPSHSGIGDLSQSYQWLLSLPALDLQTNKFNFMPELCLYNYPESEVLNKYKK